MRKLDNFEFPKIEYCKRSLNSLIKSIKFLNNKYKSLKVKIITVCRLSKEKNINEIIQAINQIEKEISLYVIGDGPEKENISKLIRSLKLEKKVKLIHLVAPLIS